MSISINDYRKHRENSAEQDAPKPEQRPVEQVAVAQDRLTGDDRFDKLIRALEVHVKESETSSTSIMTQTVACIKDEDIRKGQLIYAYHRGLIDAYNVAMKLPMQILAEEKIR